MTRSGRTVFSVINTYSSTRVDQMSDDVAVLICEADGIAHPEQVPAPTR